MEITIADLKEKFKALNERAFVKDLQVRNPLLVIQSVPKLYKNGCAAFEIRDNDEAYFCFKRWIQIVNWLQQKQLPKYTDEKCFPKDKIEVVNVRLEEVTIRIKIEFENKLKSQEFSTKDEESMPSILNSPISTPSYNFINSRQYKKMEISNKSPVLANRHPAGLGVKDSLNMNATIPSRHGITLMNSLTIKQ